jgi:hypothetical protein
MTKDATAFKNANQGCQGESLALLAFLPNNKNIKTLLRKDAKSATLPPLALLRVRSTQGEVTAALSI